MFSQTSRLGPRTFTLFVLPLLTLAFPLVVLLVVLQRLPAEEIQLASTDYRLLQPVSTFWCAAQEINSGHPFNAYKVPKVPPILKDQPHLHTLAFRFSLLKGKYHLLRYHLLAGSTLELAGCTNQYPAPVDVFYGKEAWADCLSIMTGGEDDDSSEKSDSSLSDSDESMPMVQELKGSSHNSQYHHLQMRSSASRNAIKCSNTVLSGWLNTAQRNEEPSPSCPSTHHYPLSLNATRTGKYYVVVRTNGLDERTDVLLHLRLNRTTFEMPMSVLFCRSPDSCSIPLTFGAEERVVVFISAEPDAGAVLFPVRSKCQPRAAFYLVVFFLLPVLFALALFYMVKFQRRWRRNAVDRTVPQCSSRNVEVRDESEETETLKEESESPPPSYGDVVIQRRDSSNSPPPPSYEELLRQPLVSVHRL